MKKIQIPESIAIALAMLFIYAATSKLMDYSTFKAQLGGSPFIMHHHETLAWLVPGSEILISILLLIPRTIVVGLYLSFTIMLSFTVYIALMLTLSPYVPCSCGGILSNMGWSEHLVFNAAFTTVAAMAVIKKENQKLTKISIQ
ncbi:MauE/DoxX family redox-associated membrane protein [Parachryseolinea silvisoli]|uniref:MauE/DoxX family redox-associated membrane protein n=1 Tax=Parachryseolinea silvisoli TaxID=2873601 RepID=UPI0037C530C4